MTRIQCTTPNYLAEKLSLDRHECIAATPSVYMQTMGIEPFKLAAHIVSASEATCKRALPPVK